MYRHHFVEAPNLPEAYHKALVVLEREGPIYPCPDYNTDIKEIGMTMFVENATAEPFISRLFPGGHRELQQYTMEIVDGVLDFKIGDGLCWEYTYHNRFEKQLPWLYSELRRNADTRRAVMGIRDFAVDSINKDPACLQSIQFLYRDGRLNMQVMMRSNDAVRATYMNAVGFIALQRRVAEEMGYPVGSYTHTAHSFHAYRMSYELLTKYVEDIESKPLDKITYDYEGFYKELMLESVPDIMNTINVLKANMAPTIQKQSKIIPIVEDEDTRQSILFAIACLCSDALTRKNLSHEDKSRILCHTDNLQALVKLSNSNTKAPE